MTLGALRSAVAVLPARLRQRPPAEGVETADLTILVLTWTRREDPLVCLASLAQANLDGATVMVVDNGSTDGSVEAVRERFPAVRVVALPQNEGFAGGNN